MEPEIKKLIDLTTIVSVEDNSYKTIFGPKSFISRYQRRNMRGFEKEQKEQIDLGILAQNWENKWESFGYLWNNERQNYRFLNETFNLFYISFEQLRFNKFAFHNEIFRNILNKEEILKNKPKMLHYNELTGVSLYGMYNYGKKCIDLLKELKLINENHNDWKFLNKFNGTRNKLIEHNYNPYGLNLQIEPSIWSLTSTNSLLTIEIHKPNIKRAYTAYVDYYEDYYKLEKIITDIIKTF